MIDIGAIANRFNISHNLLKAIPKVGLIKSEQQVSATAAKQAASVDLAAPTSALTIRAQLV